MMNTLSLHQLLCNRLQNPLGFHMGSQPRLSWLPEAGEEAVASTRIEIATDEGFSTLVHDSGELVEVNPVCYPAPVALQPRTRYHWRVTIRGEKGGIASRSAWFETAKLQEPWEAQWISPDFDPSWHPLLFSSFTLAEEVVSARAYVCGLGLYEMRLNHNRCGDEFLAPGLCAYDQWLPYQTYDITASVKKGDNRVEIMLGNGWYKGRYGLTFEAPFQYGHEFACICEIHIAYANGGSRIFSSDLQWNAKRSAVLSSGIFDGETRDDCLDNTAVFGVKPAAIDKALLEARRSPPTRIMHRIKPVQLLHTPNGEVVLDMGQNMTGWLEFACAAPKGTELHLQFGEVLQNGNFYRDNLRTALAEYRYTSDGVPKTIRPFFTFYGFRYVRLTAWYQPEDKINLEDFVGLALYSDMQATGSIVTGNEKVNALFQNTLWSQRDNFLDVPTDCPQRDERMGWTGDAQVFFGTAAFNMDVSVFFSKYCYDMMREQALADGAVPVVIPRSNVPITGACAWGDAATIIPWNLYIRYGDIEILRQQYAGMKAWVDYVRRQDEATGGNRLWEGQFHYCDWLALDNDDPIGNRFGGTEGVYLASCFYRHSALLVSKAAHVLGKAEEATEYLRLSEEVRSAIVKEYVTRTGRLAITTQTAYVLALFFDIMPEHWREQTAYALRRKLKDSNFHLRTGFIGTPYLCRVLSQTGSNDLAYRLLLQEDYPSWLYEVNMGATTIWERWNSILPDGSISDTGMNSLNHYSYGSIVEWMYRNAAGINPLEEYPAFKRFALSPQPRPELGSLKAEFLSPAGRIRSEWQYCENGDLELCFEVPYGTIAELSLPEQDCEACELGAGVHTFRYAPASNARPKCDFETPIGELIACPATKKILDEELPDLKAFLRLYSKCGALSLGDLVCEKYFSITAEQEKALCQKLSAAYG